MTIFQAYIVFVGKRFIGSKTINVVIQRPGDKNPTIIYRDAPPNSFFELVLWIPLVDCEKSKSMYTIDIKLHLIASTNYQKSKELDEIFKWI